MKNWGWILCFLLGPVNTMLAQKHDSLIEIEVIDYQIELAQGFKQEKIKISGALNSTQNLGEALRELSPIFVRSYGSNGIATLSLRGSSSNHSRVTWNNIDISSPNLGLVDYSTLALSADEEVNLLFGLGSITEGSGAFGGSFQIKSGRNWQEGFHGSVSQELGSFSRQGTNLNLKYSQKKFLLSLHLYQKTAANNFPFIDISEAHRPLRNMRNSDFRQKGIKTNFSYRLSPKSILRLNLWYNEVDRQLPPPITGDLNNSDQMLDHNLVAVLEGNFSTTVGDFMVNWGQVYNSNLFYLNANDSESDNRFTSHEVNGRWKKEFSRFKLKIESGLQGKFQEANSPSYFGPSQRNLLAVFANAEKSFSDNFGSYLILRKEQSDGFELPLMGSLGLFYKDKEQGKYSLAYSNNYRLPSLNDLYWTPGGNPDLKIENSFSIDLRAQQSFSWQKIKFELDATLYYSEIDELIQWLPRNSIWSPFNVKFRNILGQELKVTLSRKIKEWKISSSAQLFTNQQNPGSSIKLKVPYNPRASANFQLMAENAHWLFRYLLNYTDQYYIDEGGDFYMPAYAISDLQAVYHFLHQKLKYSLGLKLQNIGNYSYQILPYRPEPAFNFLLNFNLQW
jgi:vitamin B12 transporter